MIYFCRQNKRSQTLANPLMLHSQRIRYPLMTNGVATFRNGLPLCLSSFSRPPVSEYGLAWEHGISPLSFLLERKLHRKSGSIEAIFFFFFFHFLLGI